MTYKVCYWDEIEKVQKERDATPEETAEIDARKAGVVARNQEEMLKLLANARGVREIILNRLAGICVTAMSEGDSNLVSVCTTARQSLLDIPQASSVVAAQTPAELKAAIKAEYAVIVAAAPEGLHNAFDAVDA